MIRLLAGDCVEAMRGMDAASVDAIVTDPPYGLTFMGKAWDADLPHGAWPECLRVLKPGGHMLVAGIGRTHHRMMVAVEDAGFEVRDVLMHLFGSGFPKSHNLRGKHDGYGTALKPAWEAWALFRKPLSGTVAANVQAHGTGALNVDGCRVASGNDSLEGGTFGGIFGNEQPASKEGSQNGRWPPNLLLSHLPECERVGTRRVRTEGMQRGTARNGFGESGSFLGAIDTARSDGYRDPDGLETIDAWRCVEGCAVAELGRQSGTIQGGKSAGTFGGIFGNGAPANQEALYDDTGTCARFFPQFQVEPEPPFLYMAKAGRAERNAGAEGPERPLLWSSGSQSPGTFQAEGTNRADRNHHPTVKPIGLMRWLCRLVTPPRGLILDPFLGSGTTGCAAVLEGFGFVGIEREAEYMDIARARIDYWGSQPRQRHTSVHVARTPLLATRMIETQSQRERRAIWEWLPQNFVGKDEWGRPTPFMVEPHLARILADIVPEGESELPYRLAVISTVKKSGKTLLNAAIMTYLAFEWFPQGSELYVFANSLEQAQGRVYQAAKYAVEHNSRLREQCDEVLLKEMRLRGGTVIKAQAAKDANIAGSEPAYSAWCVDDQTEALTRHNGFKLVVDLTTDDEIATLNPATGKMEWHKPRHVNVTPYNGTMVHFQHRRADFMVTPNHRVWGRFIRHSRSRAEPDALEWRFEEAQVARGFAQGYLRGSADWDGVPGYDTALAKLIGYYVAEGCMTSGVTAFIAQDLEANPETYAAIVEVVRALGLPHTARADGIRITDEVLARQLAALGKAESKHVPEALKDADGAVLTAFFEAYLQGDGWRTPRGLWQCCTVSPRLRDDLMEIALKLGYHPRWMNTRQRDNQRPVHRLSFSRGPIAWERSYKGKRTGQWVDVEYEGLVACPSVEHGIFFIRRNGKTCFTGNTELWGYTLEAERRAWDEMTPPPTVVNSMRVVDTYAGWEGESDLLWDIYQRAMHSERLYAEGFEDPRDGSWVDEPLPIYVDRDARFYCFWDTGEEARRMPWQRGEGGRAYYIQQGLDLRPSAFARLHGNLWARREDAFVLTSEWNLCSGAKRWKPGDKGQVVMAADAAKNDDHMALVGVRWVDGVPSACYVKEWEPQPDDRMGGSRIVDPSDIERELVSLREQGMRISVVGYDAYQFHSVALRLAEKGFNVEDFSQGERRLRADTSLHDRIREGTIRHSNWPALNLAVASAAAREYKDSVTEKKAIRIVKGTGKVDPLVALSMAVALLEDIGNTTSAVVMPKAGKPRTGIGGRESRAHHAKRPGPLGVKVPRR